MSWSTVDEPPSLTSGPSAFPFRAEGLAGEIKDLQGQLADYNMLVDKLNTSTEMEDMINDCNTVKAQNDSEAESIDVIFTERRGREEALGAAEEALGRERQVADEVVQTMPAAKQDKYFNMAATNEELLQEMAVLQEELDVLVSRKEEHEAELAHSAMKQEAVQLHQMLSALQLKRDAMEEEHEGLGSPQEERDKLLQQVKEDNQEIATMTRQLTEVRDRTGQITEELRQLEQDSEEVQGERQQKYKDLKKKEDEMDRFLDSFDGCKAQEEERTTQSQENIVSLLEHCSRNMLRLQQVATVTASELRSMQEVLVSKETEVVHSESTARGLVTESQRLQQDLEKVQQLEGKITEELSGLKERVSGMEAELDVCRDLETLKRTAEEKKRRLQEERLALTQRLGSLKQLLDEVNGTHEALKARLQDNETHAQLANLERKWQHLEQNNFVMKEFIASKSQESDFESVAKKVYQQVAEHNKSLVDALQSRRTV
ncbi:intraflagellar transport protein 74 homolog isoform X2 [Brachionichthys hirsutus]|uniref:intraflagellar transport protein 74 homolog isoform X2 n=1 Tax=Brachionichthys hirsutus TaxID=412623 RepID=UPI003604424A